MKKEKSRGSAKRLIIILSLTLALIIALGAFSFAWIRNYVSVDSLGIQTGKLLYDIKIYDGNGKELSDVFTTPADNSNSTDEIVKAIDANLEINDSIEFFFVIKKYAESIDFDVALSFDWDKREGANYDYVGQPEYSMYDASSEISSGVTFSNITANYISNAGDGTYLTFEPLTSIFDKTQKTSLSGDGDDYACIRLKITVPEGKTSPDILDKIFHLETRFCVAQTGALDDGGAIETIRVTDTASLKDAMASYGYGDTIYIESSDPARPITYDGDLVFTRPCKVVLVRTTLEITGNLIFSYIYDDYFELSTAADGHIKVMKNGAGDGGHFQIELPNATMKLTGANNVAEGKADVYVDGNFTANASTNEAKGITFERLKVCQAATADSAESLKDLTVDGSSRMVVANSTNLGKLSTDTTCKKLHLINKGSIEAIDLRGMSQDTTYLHSPTIFIDNYGVVGGDKTIYLPGFSIKYDDTDTKSGLDNTRIIANKGSELIKAITPNESFPDSADGYVPSEYFFSTGVKMTDGTKRDDIEYDDREIYVEKVNGDPTKIVVHYENIPPVLGGDTCETLKDYIEYYSGEKVSADQKIAAVEDITEMKVICYSGKVLDYSDYSFIKTMTALTTLDLSESGSEDMRVPDNAFKGMTALTDVKMPERDIIWGKNIFTNTGVDEITFPQALTTLDNYNSSGKITAQHVLDGIKYVRTSITVVDGMWLNTTAKQYFFVPDEFTRAQYRNLHGSGKNAIWNSKIFIDNGAVRDGEFFYRVTTIDSNYPTCEFIAYTGEGKSWAASFDFNEINGYDITAYDPYAFYHKFVNEDVNIDIVIGDNVEVIGEYAFACKDNTNVSTGINSVTINGNAQIKGYVFYNNDAITSVKALEVTALEGDKNFYGCGQLTTFNMPKLIVVEGEENVGLCLNLQRVDISVIQKNDTNSGFYTSDDSYEYAKFYIHTENAMPKSSYTSALAADYRMIFVNENYASLYRVTPTYTGVTDIGDNLLTDIISANADGTDLKAGDELAYYYVINGSKAELVACMLSEINMPGEDFTTITSFNHEGVTYPVNKIGSAAYHFTKIVAQNITIHDNITELGDYAFNAQKSEFGKYCITLDLNKVVKAGKGAFYYAGMARVRGEKLEEVGENTFTENNNLVVAYLPLLSRSRPKNDSNSTAFSVFVGCESLRISYTSASNDIYYDSSHTRVKNYVRFINYKGTSQDIALGDVNTIINASVKPKSGFSRNYINVSSDFSEVILSDYYTLDVGMLGMSGEISLPGYVYYEETDGELTMFAVSPDVESFADYDTARNHTTPNRLYKDENNNKTAKKTDVVLPYTVTKIGGFAYSTASFSNVNVFKIAENVKEIAESAFYGRALINTTGNATIVTLNVKQLDLSNVEILGNTACRGSNFEKVIANNLKSVGEHAFAYCYNLTNCYFPSFETTGGMYAFRNCTGLQTITLGENTRYLHSNTFSGCSKDNFTTITILNHTEVVSLGGNIAAPASVKIRFPAAIYNTYYNDQDKYKDGFGGIKKENFEKFGNSSKVEVNDPDNPSMSYSLTYYWEILGLLDDTKVRDSSSIDMENLTGVGTATGTAYLDYVEGTFPTSGELELPSSLEGKVVVEEEINGTVYQITYTVTCNVVSVKPSLMSALSEITDVTLPSGMSYLSFTTADLADSIKSLSISGNDKFKTLDGVLYTKDGKTLLVCPKALTTADGKLTVANGVTEIFDKAFYGSKYITELEIAGVVTVRNEAFAGAGISTIKFTDTSAASVFAGKDIFLGANVNLQISVPSALLDAYKTNVLIDYPIKFITH